MKDQFPAFWDLTKLVAAVVKDAEGAVESQGSVIQKLFTFNDLIPKVIAFLPEAQAVKAELAKMAPGDFVVAAEALVADLGIANAKALAIVNASFPIAEDLANLIPKVQALMLALKA